MWKYLVKSKQIHQLCCGCCLQRWPLSVPFLSMPICYCHTKRWSLTPQTESGLASVMCLVWKNQVDMMVWNF